MKHKGRKSKSSGSATNGISEKSDENGQGSEQEVENDQAEDKRRRSSKRKTGPPKNALSSDEEDDGRKNRRNKRKNEDEDEDPIEPEKRKRSGRGVEEEVEQNDKADDKKKKKTSAAAAGAGAGKRKTASNSRNVDVGEQENGESVEDNDAKKTNKRKGETAAKESGEESEEEEETPQYEVETILDEKNIRGVKHYLIRWKGYEPESDTWEPESTLNCSELINEYKTKKGKKASVTTAATNNTKKPTAKKSKKKSVDGNDDDDATWDENEDFEVDRILDVYFKRNGKREFLVLWKGYPATQSSWEPEENMDCPELIARYMDKVEKARESDQRELRINPLHTDRFTLNTTDTGRRLSRRNKGKPRIRYEDAE